MFPAYFETYLGFVDTLNVPETLAVESFSNQKEMKSGPKHGFFAIVPQN